MELPKIKFSLWFKWSDKEKIKNSNSPGIYILAKFKSTPTGKINSLNGNVIYIGETCDSLKSRWRQFGRSAFQSKPGHSGGQTYNKIFGDKGLDLYIATMPVKKIKGQLRDSFIKYIERKLILDFVITWGELPKCNRE